MKPGTFVKIKPLSAIATMFHNGIGLVVKDIDAKGLITVDVFEPTGFIPDDIGTLVLVREEDVIRVSHRVYSIEGCAALSIFSCINYLKRKYGKDFHRIIIGLRTTKYVIFRGLDETGAIKKTWQAEIRIEK
jgi:hypothetical protein